MRLVISPLALRSSSPLFVLLPLLCLFLRCLPLPLLFLRLLLLRPPLPPAPPFSAPSSVPVPSSQRSLAAPQGGGLYALGSESVLSPAPPGFPSLSATSALLSVPPPAVSSASPSLSPGVSVLSPPASSVLSSAPFALPVLSAPALDSSPVVSEIPRLAPDPQPSLLHPFTVSDPPVLSAASALPQFSFAPLGSAAGPSGFASAASGSAFGHAGSTPQSGPSSAFPPLSGASATPSAPPLSEFDYTPDDPFAPGFGDPDASGAAAPVPPLALRYDVCTCIWSISSRRLLYLLALFSKSSLLLRRLLISLSF